jgi:regulator of G-protein signaling
MCFIQDGVALFRGFLKTEFSDENIEFWLACEDYKNTDKEQKLQTKAKKIYSEFVAIGAPREVNLDIELRMLTGDNVTLDASIDAFERAQKRIQALMEKDSYPRFLESELYRNLCNSLMVSAASNGNLTLTSK